MRWWSDNFQFLKCSLFSRPNSSYLLSLPGSMFQMSLSGQPKPLICVPVGERVQPAGIHFGSLQQKNKLINIYIYIHVRANNLCFGVMVMGVLIPAGLQLLTGQCQTCGPCAGPFTVFSQTMNFGFSALCGCVLGSFCVFIAAALVKLGMLIIF